MLDQILATNEMLASAPAHAPAGVELPDRAIRHLLRTMDRAAMLAERGAVNEGLAELRAAHQRARAAWEARAEPWGEVLATRWEWLERGFQETYLGHFAEPWLQPREAPRERFGGGAECWRQEAANDGEIPARFSKWSRPEYACSGPDASQFGAAAGADATALDGPVPR